MAPCHKKKPTRPLRPASKAARAAKNAQAEFSFLREVKSSRRLTYLDRVLVGLVNYIDEVSPPPSGEIFVDDLMEHIRTQAEGYGETLGKRATQYINTAISRLLESKYIIRHNDVVRFEISTQLKAIMSRLVIEASAAGFEDFANLSRREHRILAEYFRLRTEVRRALNRRELELQNAALEYRLEQHKLICPLEQPQPQPADEEPVVRGLRLVQEEDRALDRAHFTDSMYMDDVPAAGPSNMAVLQTPPRKSQSMTLNNPGAYPSPQSPPRRTGSRHISSSRSPSSSRSFRMPGTLDEELGNDDDMDIDFPLRPSPVPTELVSIAGDSDGHAMLPNDFNSSYGDPSATMEVQQMLDASRIEVESLKCEIQKLNTEIENLKETLEAQRKQGLLMKVANVFLRSADQRRLQEATREREEIFRKLRMICGIPAV